jgi:hypothetical protein
MNKTLTAIILAAGLAGTACTENERISAYRGPITGMNPAHQEIVHAAFESAKIAHTPNTAVSIGLYTEDGMIKEYTIIAYESEKELLKRKSRIDLGRIMCGTIFQTFSTIQGDIEYDATKKTKKTASTVVEAYNKKTHKQISEQPGSEELGERIETTCNTLTPMAEELFAQWYAKKNGPYGSTTSTRTTTSDTQPTSATETPYK